MIIDSSALVAILLEEPGYEVLHRKVQAAMSARIPSTSVLEAAMVMISRVGVTGRDLLEEYLEGAHIEIAAFTSDHCELAIDAFENFGKGRHRAALNFGDCISYAIAKLAAEPLLYVGNDFGLTDIAAA